MTRAEAPPAAAARDAELLDAIVQTSFRVIGVVSAVAAAHELSLTQLRVLAILRSHTPTISELSDYLGLDRSTVSGLIDRASRRGLVVRAVDAADRRAVRIELTPAGRGLAAEGGAEIADGVAPLVEGLSIAERARLARLLAATAGSPDR